MKQSIGARWLCIGFLSLLGVLALYATWAWHYTEPYRYKLWLHRCNSLEKLQEQANRYKNVEVDVIIRPDGRLDVTHDADTTFHLTIEPYFAHIARRHSHLWLDIKNVDTQNVQFLAMKLDTLCRRYEVEKQQLIVESRDEVALSQLTKLGYYTSYYVEFDKPSRLSQAEKAACMARLRSVARSGQVRALSFPGWWYDEIHRELQVPSIDLLTWMHRSTEAEVRLWPMNLSPLSDSQLKVILVKSKGKYHR